MPCTLPRLTLLTVLMAPAALHAQETDSPAAHLEERAGQALLVLQGKTDPAEIFTPSFLAAVPPDKLRSIAGQLTAQFGELTGADEVKPTGAASAQFLLRMEKAKALATIQLDSTAPYRIAGFRISEVQPMDDSPQKLLADFTALPGSAGFALVKLGDGEPGPILSNKGHVQLAIGSAFKLWVLDALAEEVARGRRKWSDVTQLGLRSLPSGDMQDWPQGASVTLETLAIQMIAKSDNTATDTLIRLLGRDVIAARLRASGHSAPERTLPLLTTLEAFTLKAGGQAQGYGAADEAGQAAILARLAPGLDPAKIDLASVAGDHPNAIDSAEWFAAPHDMVRLLDTLRKRNDPKVLEILEINPGIGRETAQRNKHFGFKGGSEPGVMSLNFVIQARDGTWYAAAMSWNDPEKPVDNARFVALAQRLVRLIH